MMPPTSQPPEPAAAPHTSAARRPARPSTPPPNAPGRFIGSESFLGPHTQPPANAEGSEESVEFISKADAGIPPELSGELAPHASSASIFCPSEADEPADLTGIAAPAPQSRAAGPGGSQLAESADSTDLEPAPAASAAADTASAPVARNRPEPTVDPRLLPEAVSAALAARAGGEPALASGPDSSNPPSEPLARPRRLLYARSLGWLESGGESSADQHTQLPPARQAAPARVSPAGHQRPARPARSAAGPSAAPVPPAHAARPAGSSGYTTAGQLSIVHPRAIPSLQDPVRPPEWAARAASSAQHLLEMPPPMHAEPLPPDELTEECAEPVVPSAAQPAWTNALSGRARVVEACVFWSMLLIGSTIYAVCLFIPLWDSYMGTRGREAVLVAQRDELIEQQAALQRMIGAIHTDPQIIEELARSELNYTRPGELQVRIRSGDAGPAGEPTNVLQGHEALDPPQPHTRATALLGQLRNELPTGLWSRLLHNPTLRRNLMLLSGAMVLLSLIIFGFRRSAPPAETTSR